MKLRQKLAVVLASAMVLTAVPVVTMAASTSYASKIIVTNDKIDTTLIIDVKDSTTSTTQQVVYLDLNGAKVDDTKYPAKATQGTTEFTVEKIGDTSLKVTLAETVAAGKINIPIFAKGANADEITVKIDGDATKTIENATVVIGKKNDAKATVTADDAKKIDGEGEVAKITIAEPFKNVLTKDGKKITLTLQNSDYYFVKGDKITVKPIRGLEGETGFTATIKSTDDQVIEITVPAGLSNESAGKLEITGVNVKYDGKNAPQEDINIVVDGDNVTSTTLTVAKVTEYAGQLVLSDKAVDIVAGQEKEVKVKLKETLADSFVEGKTVDFTIDKGYLKAVPEKTTPIYKNNKDKKADELIGFTYVIPEKATAMDEEFTLTVVTKLGTEGDVTLTAEGSRAIGEDLTLVVANVKKAFEVSVESLAFQTGVKGQKGGVLTITETAKGQLAAGKTFQIQLQDGAEFDGDADVKVTSGDLIIESVKKDSTTASILNVTVKRASKTASTIEISNFKVKANRLLADGSYSVKLSGEAALGKGQIEVKDFLLVGEAAPAGTSTFTLNATTYTVNGKAYTMDVAPYIEAGRIMVPVKYVAAALGVDAANVIWDQVGKTVTIFGDRTVQVTLGSNVALVNGAPLTMDGKVVMQSNRTFVPVAEIGKLLGVKAVWDDATKSATFTN